MKLCGYISRNVPSLEEVNLAEQRGYTLIDLGSKNPFTVTKEEVNSVLHFNSQTGKHEVHKLSAVCVNHPAAALRLIRHFDILLFKYDLYTGSNTVVELRATQIYFFERNNDGRN